jgi:hypothetical protein
MNVRTSEQVSCWQLVSYIWLIILLDFLLCSDVLYVSRLSIRQLTCLSFHFSFYSFHFLIN